MPPHSTASEVQFYPGYDNPEADTTFLSKDGIAFRVRSDDLIRASPFFRTMFEMPRASNGTPQKDRDELLPMEAPAPIIKALLDVICPDLPFPSLDSLELFQGVLKTAIQYDMDKAVTFVRILIPNSPVFLRNPLALYAMACDNGWNAERKMAATRTLAFDLDTKDNEPFLTSLTGRDLYALVHLRNTRKQEMLEALSGVWKDSQAVRNQKIKIFASEVQEYCPMAECRPLRPAMYDVLELRVAAEMDKVSLGTTLNSTFWNHRDIRPVWQAKCSHMYPILKKETFIDAVRRALGELTQTVV